MRGVFRAVLRLAAGVAVAAILLTPAAIASASDGSKKPPDPLIHRIVAWIQSRISVPGG